MKIFGSDRAVFISRTVLVCVLFALTLAACIFGSLAVSGEGEIGNYLPHVAKATAFRITLACALAVAVALLFIFKNDRKGKQPNGEGEECEPSRYLSVTELISRCLSVLPAIVAFYVFYFALTDESLGSWGNAVMTSAFVSALFFLFKIFKNARVGKVICGFGVFALSAVVIASLYLDHVIEINSDFKLLVQFGAAGVIMGTIADIRVTLSRISRAWFISLKASALVLCAACSAVILSLSVAHGEAFPLSYFVYSRLYLACAVPFGFEIISALIGDRSRFI